MDNLEQMKAIAKQCPYFAPYNKSVFESTSVFEHDKDCTMCEHYDKGLCNIKDEILTSMDQT